MKTIIATLTIALALTLSLFGLGSKDITTYDPSIHRSVSEVSSEPVDQVAYRYVRGYTKKNGTYVAPYYRSSRYDAYDKYGNYKYRY